MTKDIKELPYIDCVEEAKLSIQPILFGFANIETMSVILNILNHCQGKLPEDISNLGHLLDGTQLHPEIYMAIGNAEFELSDDLITSMIDGDLCEWINNTIIEAYFKVHKDMLHMYMNNWDTVKSSIESFTQSMSGK